MHPSTVFRELVKEGLDTIAFRVRGPVGPGSYRVQVAGGGEDYDYTTNLLDCG